MASDIEKRVMALEKALAVFEEEEDIKILMYVCDFSKGGGGDENGELGAVIIGGRIGGSPGYTITRLEKESEEDFLIRLKKDGVEIETERGGAGKY